MTEYDFTIIGAGIIGLATAVRVREQFPRASIAVVDKAPAVAAHQSGHNSGVIHAGVYYEPGTLKARLCGEGLRRTIAFCRAHDVPFEQCGKLLVATSADESERLDALYRRARINEVRCELITASALRELEPHIAGTSALRVFDTGIVDYARVCETLAQTFPAKGIDLFLDTEVTAISERAAAVHLDLGSMSIATRQVVVCAGLQSDRLAKLAGLSIDFAVLPFRGDFFTLSTRCRDLVNHLIYPVPDPSLPFLGVHLTATIDGGLTAGPSAMLAFARETYSRSGFDLGDTLAMGRHPGSWRLLARFFRAGLVELKHAFSRQAYCRAVQRYCPAIEVDDLVAHHCGIRAQAVSRDGHLIGDFLVEQTPRMVHVCNAPSPAATAAFPIAEYIVEKHLK